MSHVFVTFKFRYRKTSIKLEIKTPIDLSGLTDILKNELKLEETEELMLLCPTLDGNMMELQSDDDVKFLMETKIAYNAVTKTMHCNVELVVIIINNLLDDKEAQFMILSKKIDNLTFKVDKLSDFIENTDENKSSTFSAIRSESKEKNTFLSELDQIGFEPNLDECKKNTEEDKESLLSETNDNLSPTLEMERFDALSVLLNFESENVDSLFHKLKAYGFTDEFRNIIVLKKFNNDYEKAINSQP
ncbi:unnamed protein product [Aphis gossypii]|uniref:Uncharacterized protein n=1 Tax=Aphis gossypii TaxID=80765 RepID=A0A9P0NR20_APHGO|nr:unnamed protein product [Aphis gossypii]